MRGSSSEYEENSLNLWKGEKSADGVGKDGVAR